MFAAVLLFALLLVWRLRGVLEVVYVSGLFAVVLSPLIDRLMKVRLLRWQPSRPVAVVLLVLAFFSALGILLWLALPPVLRDLQRFAVELPERLPSLLEHVQSLPMGDKLGIDQLALRAPSLAGQSLRLLLVSTPDLVGKLLHGIFAVILTVYFLLEGKAAYLYFLSFVPEASRERLARTLLRAEERMSKWLLGQGVLMLVLGLTSTIVFGALHVRYYFLLGVLMGLFNIIPVAGGLITISLAALVAALDSWGRMAGVLIFYAIYVQLENGFLTPRIMRTRVNLMGLSVLIALLAGTALAGIVGTLVAVPTAALIGVLMGEYLVQKDAGAAATARKADLRAGEADLRS